MASLTGSLGDAEKSQLKAWFAAQRARAKAPAAEPLAFPLRAADVFGVAAPTSGGALGLDFVEARAPHALVDVGALPALASRPKVKQNLRFAQKMGEGGIGAVVWNCGRALCHALPRLPEVNTEGAFNAGTRVLELGCGTGLVGLACWLRGADVDMTDLPEIAPLAFENAASCVGVDGALPAGLHVAPHAWGDLPLRAPLVAPYDVVVGSDCLYDAKALPALLATLLAVTDENSVVYLVYKRRVDEREAPFFADLEAHFGDVAFTETDAVPEAWRGTGLHVVRLAKRVV